MRCDAIVEAAHLVHPPGAEQFAHQVDQPGAADAFGRHVADDAERETRRRRRWRRSSIAPSSPGMPQAIAPPSNAGPAGQDAARIRCSIADDQLGVGADVHDRHQAVFVAPGRPPACRPPRRRPTWPLMIGTP